MKPEGKEKRCSEERARSHSPLPACEGMQGGAVTLSLPSKIVFPSTPSSYNFTRTPVSTENGGIG
jgi:hypothetical protein